MNLKSLYLTALLLTITLISCSPESNTNTTPENTGEFNFNGVNYPLITAIITEEEATTNSSSKIGINLFNKTSAEITSNNDTNEIDYVYFEFTADTIENTTYNSINRYDISVDGAIVDSEFISGTIFLSDSDPESDVFAQSGSVTVTNFTAYNIVFSFTFTRTDGQIITGSYDGNYLLQNN